MENTFDTWFKRILVALFHFGALVVPLVFAFNTEELFEFNKMIFVYAWSIAIGGFWLARMIVQKKVLVVKTPLDLPIIGFVFSQLLATLFSIHPYTSLFGYYSRFHGGLLSSLAYVLLFYAFVATFSESSQQKSVSFWQKPIIQWLYSLILGSILASVYALPEHFGYSLSCQLATGKLDVSCWVQDVQNRIFGSFGQPNWLAAYLALLLPIGMSLLLLIKKNILRVGLLSIISLWYCVLLFTKSRSGLLGLVVGLVFMLGWLSIGLAMRTWSMKKISLKLITVRLGITGLLLLVFTLFFGTPLTPSIAQMFSPSEAPAAQVVGPALEAGGTESGEIRKIVWQGAIDVWKRYPLVGSGLETFAYSYYKDRPLAHNGVSEWDFLYNKAHNEWLNFLATTGTIGFIAFLGLLFSPYIASLLWMLRLRKLSTEDQDRTSALVLTGGILGGLSALHVSNFFGFSTVTVTMLQFLLMGVLVTSWNPKNIQSSTNTKKPLNVTQYLFLSGLAVLSLVLLGKTISIRQADVLFTEGKVAIQRGQISEGSDKILSAITLRPQEASYYSTLGGYYANIAGQLYAGQQASQAATLANQTATLLESSTQANPVHYTLYLSKIGSYLQLAPMGEVWLEKAMEVVGQAKELAPTDPRPWLLEGKILGYRSEYEQSITSLNKALELKPNYAEARGTLATIYELQNNSKAALEQYQYILEYISPDDELLRQKVASMEAQLQR